MKTPGTAALLFCLILLSCRQEAPSGTVTFHHYAPGALAKGMEALADLVQKAQPGLRMSMVPVDHESFKSSILKSVTQGNPPELFTYWAGARTQALLPHLEPLDELWNSQGWDKDFPPSLVRSSVTYGGRKYLLPMTLQFIGIFYNKAVFSQAGQAPPENWEDFLKVCGNLKAKGITPLALGAKDRWPAQFWFDYLLLRTAGKEFRDRLLAGEEKLDSPEILEVFSRWKDLLDQGYFNPHPERETWDSFAAGEVLEGRAAMTLNGTWTLGYFQALHPEKVDDIGFFPFPVISGVPRAALGYVEGVLVPRGSLNPLGAREALKFLASPAAQQHMSTTFGCLSPRSTGLPEEVQEIQEQIRREVESAPDWATNFDLSVPVPAAETALNLFREFLRFPGRYQDLVAEASLEMDKALRP